jgi:hypothetical protein
LHASPPEAEPLPAGGGLYKALALLLAFGNTVARLGVGYIALARFFFSCGAAVFSEGLVGVRAEKV